MTTRSMIAQQQTLLGPSRPQPKPKPDDPWTERPAIWTWQWDYTQIYSVEQACDRLRAYGYRDVYAKALDGQYWMGLFDSSFMAPRSSLEAAHIAQIFADHGVTLHWWVVPRAVSLDQELSAVRKLLDTNPVSIILDLEPFDEFWTGGRGEAQRYVDVLKEYDVPVALAPDGRTPHWQNLQPDIWCQVGKVIMPQLYWPSFQQPWSIATQRMWDNLSPYGLPIYPIIQADSTPWDIEAAMLNFRARGSTSFSIWVWHILPWDHAGLAYRAFNGIP